MFSREKGIGEVVALMGTSRMLRSTCNGKRDAILGLRRRVGKCKRCKELGTWRKYKPESRGNPCSGAMIMSEAPGSTSIAQKVMWSGASGKMLRKVIEEWDCSLDDVFYATNFVKCLPPRNRKPRRSEVKNCLPFLREELRILKPRVVLTLGSSATKEMLKLLGVDFGKFRMRDWHGSEVAWEPGSGSSLEPLSLFPLYHPSPNAAMWRKDVPYLDDLRTAMKKAVGVACERRG